MLEARTYLGLRTASALMRHLFKSKPIQSSPDVGSGFVRGLALMRIGSIVAKRVKSFMAMKMLNWRFYTTVCPRCEGDNTLYTVFLNIRFNNIKQIYVFPTWGAFISRDRPHNAIAY